MCCYVMCCYMMWCYICVVIYVLLYIYVVICMWCYIMWWYMMCCYICVVIYMCCYIYVLLYIYIMFYICDVIWCDVIWCVVIYVLLYVCDVIYMSILFLWTVCAYMCDLGDKIWICSFPRVYLRSYHRKHPKHCLTCKEILFKTYLWKDLRFSFHFEIFAYKKISISWYVLNPKDLWWKTIENNCIAGFSSKIIKDLEKSRNLYFLICKNQKRKKKKIENLFINMF